MGEALMATTPYRPPYLSWDVPNRYLAAAAVDVLLSNPGDHPIAFEITNGSDALPALSARDATVVMPGAVRPMSLLLNDRLWMTGLFPGCKASLLLP